MRRFLLAILAVSAFPVTAQVFDNSGNGLLNGPFYFREVIYNFDVGVAAVVYGRIQFDGAGNYQIVSAVEGDSNSGFGSYSRSGTYTISASGFGFLSNDLLGSPTYGTISNGLFIGSSTESGYNDLFVAAPINGQSTGTLQGSYTLAYIHPAVPFDAVLQMSPNGASTIGTVGLSAYQVSSNPVSQSINNVKYTVSNNAFVLTFPNSSTNFIVGQEYLYASPDGSFVFGGSPGDFDMFVGVRNGSSGTNFGGLYYQAGIDEDASQLAANVVGFDSYYGSFSANNGVVVSHQRLLGNGVSYSYTFQDSYAQNSNGTYDDKFTSAKYFGGSGGAVRIGLGVGPFLSISVAVQAPAFSGSGVYLNPAGVVNSASSAPFTAGVARGELITLVGNNLGPDTLQVASTVPFPTTLGNVQVLVNNVPAPIYYVSPNQVAALVPYQTTASVAQIKVVNNGVASNTVTELVNLTAPGVFTQPAGGLGYAAALHTDFSPVTPSSPAQPGETIAVFVTGLGDVFPGIPDGSAGPSPDFSTATNAITADVNGVAANVTYKGLAPGLAGLYQVNIEIPTGLTAGDNFLDVSGPDSYASEALIPIGGGSASPAARAVQRSPARHATPSIPFYPRRLLSEP